MDDIQTRIKKIEEEIRKTPYHKGTEHHIGKLRAKLAKLKDQFLTPKKAGKKPGFALKKQGYVTCILLGFPSAGKSTLLNQLTNTASKVGNYEFTTTSVIPGILNYQGAKIQILDLPGIISGASQGKDRGREILAAARAADLLIILIDALKLKQEKMIKKELYQAGVRLNEQPPKVVVKKKSKGGIQISMPSSFSLSPAMIKEIANEFGLVNAEIIIKEDLSLERLIDAFSQNRVYLPALFVINKIDLITSQRVFKKQPPDYLLISAKNKIGLEVLRRVLWKKLNLIRIYLKPKDGPIDRKKPLILKREATVLQAAQKISHQLAVEIKGAKIYGQKASFDGQTVGLSYQLQDGTILTFF